VEDLAEMRGNRYQSKRNFANYFEKNYKYSFEDLTLPCVKECLELQETWCNMKKCIIFKSLEAENRAIQQMFANFELLGLFGVVIRIDGKIQAFSIAEKLDEDTVVVHVQKANTEFRGIYPALNRLFCSKTIKGIKYVNWEQDLGNPGLKKAKLSYHPARLLMKYDLHY
ncbi:MAG: phosphatidylglycerol lysyltransferase domain-containing protein, partial [Elusimicrobiota bacterium]